MISSPNSPADFEPLVDAVIIGRNEGARLDACLRSLDGKVRSIVYVDSGSTDQSVAMAKSLGAVVVPLDVSLPFTAARARNAGLAALAVQSPVPDFVQFVDGDCEVDRNWIKTALAAFKENPQSVVICGRRRERFPAKSVYNRLCDREWNTPVGLALACGGDALMRYGPLIAVKGYREDLIAGEEPELCLRMRRAGGEIRRIDAEMTMHDANITRFAQWWRRSKRAGHAFAEGAALHGAPPERHWVAETRRAAFWGIVVPTIALLGGLFVHPVLFLTILLWPLQTLRLLRAWRHEGQIGREAALFAVPAKIAEAQGVAGFWLGRLRGRRRGLIEYK
jgi:cellulose synthase/poly-beta-1,6-N-acetylglucosamine synthase-like glycosyltransferase